MNGDDAASAAARDVVRELVGRSPGLLVAWVFLALVDLEQQSVALVRSTGRRRGVQLAPTVVGLAGGAAAAGVHRLLAAHAPVGSWREALPYRSSLVTAVAALVAAPLAGAGRRGVVLPRSSALWGLAVPLATQTGWVTLLLVLGRRRRQGPPPASPEVGTDGPAG